MYVNFSSGVNYSASANSVIIPEKYDYNFFGTNVVNVDAYMISPAQSELDGLRAQLSALLGTKGTPISRITDTKNRISAAKKQVEFDDSVRTQKVFNSLQDNKIANKVLSSILIDETSRSMTVEKLSKRAEYSATDADYIKAMNSESKMAAIRDKGLSLLKNVYIIVNCKITNVLTVKKNLMKMK